jgi:hypothetical protein
MADFQAARVEGARELRRALKTAGLNLDNEIKDAHRSVSNIVITRALELVPVAPTSMTTAVPGLLRDSIRAGATKTTAIVRAGTNKKVPYANPIHWGWFKRGIKPNPFLATAAAETEAKWVAKYDDAFERILDQIANSTQGVKE